MAFEKDMTYSIIIEYLGKILTSNTGVYCAMDPDFRAQNKSLFHSLNYKTIADLHLVKDGDLRANIIDKTVFCTNLEPAEARTFMPCLDEPLFKAKFKLTINLTEAQVANGHLSISNTPIERISEDGRTITF
jgi:aminopeptidase N